MGKKSLNMYFNILPRWCEVGGRFLSPVEGGVGAKLCSLERYFVIA